MRQRASSVEGAGARVSLSAATDHAAKLLLEDALRWTAGGLAVGLAGAAVAARALRSLLFHVSPGDPAAYVAAACAITALALAAAFLPSRRAARVDPATALRHD